jgi:hypothetical protein
MNQAERYLQLRNKLAVTRRGPLLVSEIPVDLSELNLLATASVDEVRRLDDRTFCAPTPWHAKPGWSSWRVLRRK